MARGSIAKTNIENKIKNAFGADFIGIVDKKVYVWADDGGERVQIAISMTCPKTFVEVVDTNKLNFGAQNAGFDFENMDAASKPVMAPQNEITEEEKNNIATLMERLGL